MNINPMMLLPMLMGMNNGNGNMEMEKITSLMSAIQGGDISPILQMLGGNNEKLNGMMTLLKAMPTIMNMNKTQSVADTASGYSTSQPDLTAVDKLANNEINTALYNLLKNK